MADPEELEALARQYLDLWQDQMTALAGDPEFAQAMDKLIAATGMVLPAGAAVWSAWGGVFGMMAAAWPPARQERETSDRHDSTQAGFRGSAASGTAAAAASSGQRQSDMAEFAGRLAALEERVAALESAAGRGRKSAQPRSGRGRT